MRSFTLALLAMTALAAPALAQDGPFPVTVRHALGETVVPAAPTRIVVLTNRDTDTLLALGEIPVAINSRYDFESGVGPWAEDALGDTTPVVWHEQGTYNYEAILAMEPDLIVNVTSGGDPEEHQRLSEIAPTLALPEGAVPWGADTDDAVRLVAQALGREADGEALLAELDAYYARQRAAYPQFAGLTANYFDIFGADIYSYSDAHIVNRILYATGFSPIENATNLPAGAGSVIVSAEQVGAYDADVALVYPFGQTEEEMIATIPTLANWSSVRGGTFYVLEDLALSNSSVFSIPYALDRLLPQIAAALDARN